MSDRKYVVINSKSAITIVFIFIVSGIKQSQTANNHMEPSLKMETQKNNTADFSSSATIPILPEASSCPSDIDCKDLNSQCIKCNYSEACTYGKDVNITCGPIRDAKCNGDKQFTRQMNCRFCYQTELWQHNCVMQGNCNSVDQYYKTNCTVHDNVLCLGNRIFTKNVKCNWTQGYKWSTALLISLTLGGFGADRFYLGHWQEGIGKLFSFGGLGVWTIIDVLLISLHYLGPADGSLYI